MDEASTYEIHSATGERISGPYNTLDILKRDLVWLDLGKRPISVVKITKEVVDLDSLPEHPVNFLPTEGNLQFVNLGVDDLTKE